MKLQHHRQRFNECALCAVCTLTGTDYPTASDLFEADHGFPWSNICTLAGVTQYWIPFVRHYTGANIPLSFLYADGHAIGDDDPVVGICAVKVRFPYGYHIVVVDEAHGTVYDSNQPGPLPIFAYADYLRQHGAYIVARFTADELLLKGEQTS